MAARRLRAAVLVVVAIGAVIAVAPAVAAPLSVISPRPDRVALTVYRAPEGRGSIDLRWLNGFALVTETRRVRVPKGVATIRFQGVADGIVPVSAIVEGLPGGTIEKNRDMRLLSPASLVDGSLGRRVTLSRTDPATGVVRREDATVVAGLAPGVIVATAGGVEALRCSGLPERLVHDGVPADLSADPVLSVTTQSPSARTVTVRLSYLSGGFDWRASYVATLAADGRTLDLSAWLTLANGNRAVFRDASVQAVAGRLNRRAVAAMPPGAAELRLVCYPQGTTTSDLREPVAPPAIVLTARSLSLEDVVMPARAMAPLPPPPPPPPPPEDLGDLKLYRVPAPTTVSANGQKQVALLVHAAVPFERRYRRPVAAGQRLEAQATAIVLVMRNETTAGLGVPLPAGSTTVYAQAGADRLLIGTGAMKDRTTGETVRLAAGVSRQVTIAQTRLPDGRAVLTATNANPFPVTLDVPIGRAGQDVTADGGGIARIDGVATWTPTLPPGGRAELRYGYR